MKVEDGMEVYDPDQSEVIYQPGEKWQDGFCATCFCEGSAGHYEAKCNYVMCPPPVHLIKDYQFEAVDIPYACCQEYKKVACKDDENNNHTVGDTWLVPGDKCSSYSCIRESPQGELKKIKTEISCDNNCQAHQEYVEPPSDSDECCGQCKVVACLDEMGQTHQVGEQWESTITKCHTVHCKESEGQGPISEYMHKVCPLLPPNCPEDKIIRDDDDCCDICTAPPEVCQPQEVNVTDTRGIFEVLSNGRICTNKEPIERYTRCMGKCESQTEYSADKNDYSSMCSCCTPSESENREIDLSCTDDSTYPFSFQQPISCSCTPCTGGEQFNLELPKRYH
uniref:MUC5AC n=1 Tax=Hemiscolopendra marginata TaxID=943146 RepID=A0A646QE65_9MYRI